MGAVGSPGPEGAAPWRGLALIGFMGAGKSTAAAALARELGVEAIDTDAEVQERSGRTIAQLFEDGGEGAFREIEERVVLEVLERAPAGAIVSLGGGSVLSERVRDALGGWLVVLLSVDGPTAWERVSAEASERPLVGDGAAFLSLHAQRRPLYESVAGAFIAADAGDVAVKALPGLRALAAAPRGTRMVWASASSGEYPVLFGAGLVVDGPLPPAAWPLDRERSRAFCVSDRNVAALYGGRLGELAAAAIEIEPGESAKTLAGAERVWSGLVEAGMTRADHVVALGGGVVGDLAGFCAATYQRGVPVVQVPTTLVAQVDSAYGGKTGVDLPQAKNYVGAYHQPAGVICDPQTLLSLPERELAAGWVEVLKTALIAGGPLWERVSAAEPGAGADEQTILSCLRVKLGIVACDERDAGARQALNLGHTIGHAIEAATGYRRYLHGEAVGIGLLAALRLSGADGLRSQVRELLGARGLPVVAEGLDVEEVVAATALDKKRLAGSVPFVLLERPGEVRLGCELAEAQVRAAVAEICG